MSRSEALFPGPTGNWRVKRVEAVAAFSGYKIEEVITEMSKVKEDDFLAKFPFGCVPAFESDDGLCIGEASAIAQYGERSRCNERLAVEPKARQENGRHDEIHQFIPVLIDTCRGIFRRVVPSYR